MLNGGRPKFNAFGFSIEFAAKTEELNQSGTSGSKSIARSDGILGFYVNNQFVEVGALLNAGGFYLVGHLQHGRIDRVHGDTTNLDTLYFGVGGCLLYTSDAADDLTTV